MAGRNAAAYSSAKAAELHLARCLAEEGGPAGIRVNTVNPDAVLSGSRIWDSSWREERAANYGIAPDELEEHYRARTTLGVNIEPRGHRGGRAAFRLRRAVEQDDGQPAQRRRRRAGRVPALSVGHDAPVRAALFITCFNDTLFPQTGRAAVAVLERVGVQVDFPLEQTCCGQMHANSGYGHEAIGLVRRFVRVFGDAEAVVTPSGSCAAMVREGYERMAAEAGDERARRAGARRWRRACSSSRSSSSGAWGWRTSARRFTTA